MLDGSKVTLTLSDPWDLGDRLSGFIEGVVSAQEAEGRDTILMRLTQPVDYRGVRYERLVLQARNRPSMLVALTERSAVDVSAYGVPPGEDLPPLDAVKRWRGGLGAIGAVRLG